MENCKKRCFTQDAHSPGCQRHHRGAPPSKPGPFKTEETGFCHLFGFKVNKQMLPWIILPRELRWGQRGAGKYWQGGMKSQVSL